MFPWLNGANEQKTPATDTYRNDLVVKALQGWLVLAGELPICSGPCHGQIISLDIAPMSEGCAIAKIKRYSTHMIVSE
jgi:hypothetical protein